MASSIPKFADFGKSFTDDLVSKDDFPLNKFNLKINSTTANKVKFTVNGAQPLDGGALTGDIKAKFGYRDVTFTETVTLPAADKPSTLRFQTDFKDLFTVPNLKLETDATLAVGGADGKGRDLKATTSYAHEFANVQLALTSLDKRKFELSAASGANNIYGGFRVNLDGDNKDKKVTSVQAGATLVQRDFDVTLLVTRQADALSYTASFTHDVLKDNSVRIGAQVTHAAGKTGFTLAARHRLDYATTLRARIADDGHFSISFAHLLNQDVKLTVVTQTTSKLAKTELGFGLVFGN